MRIRAWTKEATNVEAVFVDDKHVKMPFEFDTEEGWCDAYILQIRGKGTSYSVEQTQEEVIKNQQALDLSNFGYDLVRLKGTIRVIYVSEENDE